MSIERVRWDRDSGNVYELTCEGCGEVEEVEGEFQDVLNYKEENGWQSQKRKNAWGDYCSDCVAKSLRVFKGGE